MKDLLQEITDRSGPPHGYDEDALAALDRIVASPRFRGALRLQQLLRHLVLQTLSGNTQALREARLGIDVFGHGDHFDPSADSIVRTQATLLWKRLAEYYAGPGKEDPIRIAILRGGHLVQVSPKQECAPRPPETPSSGLRWRPWMHLAAGIVAGMVATLLGVNLGSLLHSNSSDLPVWSSFVRNSEDTTIAVGAPYRLSIGRGLILRDVGVNGPSELTRSKFFSQFPLLAHAARQLFADIHGNGRGFCTRTDLARL